MTEEAENFVNDVVTVNELLVKSIKDRKVSHDR